MASARPISYRAFLERHRFWILAVVVVTLLGLIELTSFVILAAHSSTQRQYPYNRIISGYYVSKNVPGYPFWTIKKAADQPEARTDQFGFFSDRAVTKEKGQGVVRVFLMGGSAAFGSGQHRRFDDIRTYPSGLYSYPLSISGLLKDYLTRHVDGVDFEVITAASHNRVLHQSLALYLETVSQFSPDYVVNLDGFNDVYSFVNGRPYANTEEELEKFVGLWAEYENPMLLRRLNTYLLLEKVARKERRKADLGSRTPTYDYDDCSEVMYRQHLSSFIRNSERFKQVLSHYIAVLQSDGVGFVFALQPMLHRSGNKELSAIEAAMRSRYPRAHEDDEIFRQGSLVYKFFFDDHLGEELEQLVEGEGAEFIDVNRSMASLGSDFEFYTDYCHLTVGGNRFVAELVGARLKQMLLAGMETH